MVNKAITQNDLANLEKSIKLDVSTEQAKLRHNLDNKLGTYFFKVDELEKKSAVNDNILKNMTEKIENLEKVMTTGFEKITNKIDGFQDKFATKDDHKENVTRISGIEKALDNINLKIAGVSGGFAVIIFLIDKYAGK